MVPLQVGGKILRLCTPGVAHAAVVGELTT